MRMGRRGSCREFPRGLAAFIRRPAPLVLAGLAGGAALSLAGCAEVPPQRIASGHPKEYFPSSIWGPASPRVVAEGEPVPRGGGMYMVGKPYTIAGKTYYPSEKRYAAIGLASWYGDASAELRPSYEFTEPLLDDRAGQ